MYQSVWYGFALRASVRGSSSCRLTFWLLCTSFINRAKRFPISFFHIFYWLRRVIWLKGKCMSELQPQMCLSELILPPILLIPQSIMVRGEGYLGAAATGWQFGSKARPSSLWVYCCGSVAMGRLLWVSHRWVIVDRSLWFGCGGLVVVDWLLWFGYRKSIAVI